MQSRTSFVPLRPLLLLDAVTSAALALLLLTLAGPLAGLLGLPVGLLRGAGLVLIPFAAMLALVVQRGARSRAAVGTVALCNALWVGASVALLFGGTVQPTPAGTAFVVAQAAAVAVFAWLQAASLRSPAATAAT
jgi:hypothetical protein